MRVFNSLLGIFNSLLGIRGSLFGSAGFPAPGAGKLPQVSAATKESRQIPAPDGKNSLPQGISLRRGRISPAPANQGALGAQVKRRPVR
jgi:hypothetical protein